MTPFWQSITGVEWPDRGKLFWGLRLPDTKRSGPAFTFLVFSFVYFHALFCTFVFCIL